MGSLFASSVEGPVRLMVSFRPRNNPDTILASTEVQVPDGGKWTKLPFRLRLPAGAVKPHELVDFAVSMTGARRVSLDMIRLYPADAVEGLLRSGGAQGHQGNELLAGALGRQFHEHLSLGGRRRTAGQAPHPAQPGLGDHGVQRVRNRRIHVFLPAGGGAADDLHEPGKRHRGRSQEMGGVRQRSAHHARRRTPRGQRPSRSVSGDDLGTGERALGGRPDGVADAHQQCPPVIWSSIR